MSRIEILLDNVEITSNAVFYKLNKPLSDYIINKMFTHIVKNKEGIRVTCKDSIRNNTRESNVYISFLIFYMERNPPFIKNLNLKERKYSYLLLMEVNGTLVVSSLNTPGVYKYLNKHIDEFGFEVIANTFSDLNPSYEKVRSQSTSILGDNIRKKVLEGVSLEKRIDGYNSIPLSVSLKTKDARNSITMSTSRISTNNGRGSIREFIDWAKSIIIGINSVNKDNFINTFATPVKLDEIKKKKLKPMGILLNLYTLEEKLFENEHDNYKICKKGIDGNLIEIPKKTIKEFFELFNEPLLIGTLKNKRYEIKMQIYNVYLKITNKSFLLYNKEFSNIYLCNNNLTTSQKLSTIINKEQNFTIIFNNSSYIYTNRELFLNKDIFNNIESIYSIIETYDELKDCKAEKSVNKFKETDTEFAQNTLFGIVEKNIWKNKGHLICDDLGDEWADHIAIYNTKEKGEIPYINFYISKHGESTTGASKFHDVIGQAHKNLGNINFKKEEILNKIRLWKSSNYSYTNISKLRSSNGAWDKIESDSIAVLENPLTLRNIYLVVSFLSLSKLKADIKAFNKNEKGYEHIPQLIWFISTFIGQCKEHNVKPRIICKP